MVNTHPHSNADAPPIHLYLSDLPNSDALARKIHAFVMGARASDAVVATYGTAREEFARLTGLAEALDEARRKINHAAPYAFALPPDFPTPAPWLETVMSFNAVVDPILAAIQEAQDKLNPKLERRGNQGASHNTDLQLTYISRALQDAGASDFNQRARKILDAYGVGHPSDDKAFRTAIGRGKNHLDGPVPEGSLQWFVDRRKK